jgi:hypothetical protein
MPVSALEEKPVEPLREPADLEEADFDAERLQKVELVVALEHKDERVDHEQHREETHERHCGPSVLDRPLESKCSSSKSFLLIYVSKGCPGWGCEPGIF